MSTPSRKRILADEVRSVDDTPLSDISSASSSNKKAKIELTIPSSSSSTSSSSSSISSSSLSPESESKSHIRSPPQGDDIILYNSQLVQSNPHFKFNLLSNFAPNFKQSTKSLQLLQPEWKNPKIMIDLTRSITELNQFAKYWKARFGIELPALSTFTQQELQFSCVETAFQWLKLWCFSGFLYHVLKTGKDMKGVKVVGLRNEKLGKALEEAKMNIRKLRLQFNIDGHRHYLASFSKRKSPDKILSETQFTMSHAFYSKSAVGPSKLSNFFPLKGKGKDQSIKDSAKRMCIQFLDQWQSTLNIKEIVVPRCGWRYLGDAELVVFSVRAMSILQHQKYNSEWNPLYYNLLKSIPMSKCIGELKPRKMNDRFKKSKDKKEEAKSDDDDTSEPCRNIWTSNGCNVNGRILMKIRDTMVESSSPSSSLSSSSSSSSCSSSSSLLGVIDLSVDDDSSFSSSSSSSSSCSSVLNSIIDLMD